MSGVNYQTPLQASEPSYELSFDTKCVRMIVFAPSVSTTELSHFSSAHTKSLSAPRHTAVVTQPRPFDAEEAAKAGGLQAVERSQLQIRQDSQVKQGQPPGSSGQPSCSTDLVRVARPTPGCCQLSLGTGRKCSSRLRTLRFSRFLQSKLRAGLMSPGLAQQRHRK